MRWVVVVLLLIAAHFSLTPFAPAKAGWLLWPFGDDSKPWLGSIGGLPNQPGSALIPIIGGLAGLGFIAALVGLFWTRFPPNLWPLLVIIAAALSILLYVLYFGHWAILPILLDAALICGVFVLHWSVAELRGS